MLWLTGHSAVEASVATTLRTVNTLAHIKTSMVLYSPITLDVTLLATAMASTAAAAAASTRVGAVIAEAEARVVAGCTPTIGRTPTIDFTLATVGSSGSGVLLAPSVVRSSTTGLTAVDVAVDSSALGLFLGTMGLGVLVAAPILVGEGAVANLAGDKLGLNVACLGVRVGNQEVGGRSEATRHLD